MRNFCFTTLCLGVLVLASSGCRQTNGSLGSSLFGAGAPATTNPLAPSGTLTPVAPGQTPVFGSFQGVGPMGGSTRVTPPPTGAFSIPNNYLGSQAEPMNAIPAFQSSSNLTAPAQRPSTLQALATDDFSRPIGSGLQPVGWTETAASIPTTNRRNVSSDRRDPRAGGMQVIDLTGAPKPPGYSARAYPTQPSFAPVPQSVSAPPFLSAPPTLSPPPSLSIPPSTASFAGRVPRFETRRDHPQYSPSPAAPAPVRSQNVPFQNAQVRSGPSQSQNSPPPIRSAGNLSWRRPGTR